MKKLKPYSYISSQGEVIVLAPSKKSAWKNVTLQHEPGLKLRKGDVVRVKGDKPRIIETGLNVLKAEAMEGISLQEMVDIAVARAIDARFPPSPLPKEAQG